MTEHRQGPRVARSPTLNAHGERFTRTIQEDVVDSHEAVLCSDVVGFTRPLAACRLF